MTDNELRTLIALASADRSYAEIGATIAGSRWAAQRAGAGLIRQGYAVTRTLGRSTYIGATDAGIAYLRELRDAISVVLS